MIEVTFKISEVDGQVKLIAGGGSSVGTSKMERDFARKFIIHVNRFNTSYKKIHKGNRIRMKQTR
jgi:hypothetical protein